MIGPGHCIFFREVLWCRTAADPDPLFSVHSYPGPFIILPDFPAADPAPAPAPSCLSSPESPRSASRRGVAPHLSPWWRHCGAIPWQDGIGTGTSLLGGAVLPRGLRQPGPGDGRDRCAVSAQHSLLRALQESFRLPAQGRVSSIYVLFTVHSIRCR